VQKGEREEKEQRMVKETEPEREKWEMERYILSLLQNSYPHNIGCYPHASSSGDTNWST